MIDIFQGQTPRQLAMQLYQAAPNVDPTPLIGRLDSFVAPSEAAYSTGLKLPGAGTGTGLQGPQLQTGLGVATPSGELTAMGGPAAGGAGFGQIAAGLGMLNSAQPQPARLPDFQVQYPGGRPAPMPTFVPGAQVPGRAPTLSELFGQIRR